MGVLCDYFVGVLCDQLPDEFDTGEFSSDIFLEFPNDLRTLQEIGKGKVVGVERGTTFSFPTTNVTKNCQQNHRDKIVSKKSSTTTL